MFLAACNTVDTRETDAEIKQPKERLKTRGKTFEEYKGLTATN